MRFPTSLRTRLDMFQEGSPLNLLPLSPRLLPQVVDRPILSKLGLASCLSEYLSPPANGDNQLPLHYPQPPGAAAPNNIISGVIQSEHAGYCNSPTTAP